MEDTMPTLFEAALENNTNFIKENLNQISVLDERGKSLLHYAVLGSATDVVEYLLSCGLSPNIKDASFESPLFDCSRKAKIKLAKILINNKANVNIENGRKETPLHLACHKGDLDLIKLLMENGAVSSKTTDGRLPIHYAILGGNSDCLEYLINTTKDSWLQRDFQGNTLLHYATRTTNSILVEYLLSKGMNVNSLNDQFETPLFNAVRYGNKEIIKILLSNDAYISIKNRRYENPLDIGQIFDQPDNYKYLIEKKEEPTHQRLEEKQALSLAVLNRDHLMLRRLIELNTPMKKDRYEKNALDYAKEYKFELCVSLLKDYLN